MKVSEMIRDQIAVTKSALPNMMHQIRECAKFMAGQEVIELAQLGNELAAKEAMFLAMGGFAAYYDMCEVMIRAFEILEKLEGDDGEE
jgi:hypothetical protein